MGDPYYKRKLVDHIKKNISKGYDSETLKWALVGQGYSRTLVEKSIEQAHKELSESAPKFEEKSEVKMESFDESALNISKKRSWWKRLFGFD